MKFQSFVLLFIPYLSMRLGLNSLIQLWIDKILVIPLVIHFDKSDSALFVH